MSVPAVEMVWFGPADLRPLLRPLADLRADPANARRHDARNLAAVARSLELYGQRQAVVAGPGGVIVAGHARVEAARRLVRVIEKCGFGPASLWAELPAEYQLPWRNVRLNEETARRLARSSKAWEAAVPSREEEEVWA